MPRTTQIFCASTLYGAATLAAALDAGLFEPADRRLLLVGNDAAVPETAPALDAMPGFARIRERFDGVLSWNETVAPFHPCGWSPRADDIPMWERYLRLLWGLGDDGVRLVVESVHADPALAVCRLFTDAPVDVYADGLMGYGPTPGRLDPLVGTRVDRLLHPGLVPELAPLLLTEFGVPSEEVPAEALVKVLGELAQDGGDLGGVADGAERPAVLLGQCLSAPGLLTGREEEELYLRMVRGAVALGHRRLLLVPHPASSARRPGRLVEEAGRLGARLTVPERPVLAEAVFQRVRPALVVGCFPTALFTADRLYGLPVARVGTDTLLARLAPYQHGDRVPLTIADALLPNLEDAAAVTGRRMPAPERPADLAALLRAVSYVMQPRVRPELRADAERHLSLHLDTRTWRYFKRRRLTSLALPGGIPARLSFLPRNATVRRLARRARALAGH
ncbi:polysialyltransferase family glycosyltransferase [Streptomyces sp. NPDC000931]|uniref:polysialyltransferase family glycosyltransferase n=1 Tax=Streptomyces sp. NPDC000931 TaxID=3154372 RepID=UPI00332723E3